MRLFPALVLATIFCSSCATVRPPNYRHGAVFFTVPGEWSRVPNPGGDGFTLLEESGEDISILTISSGRLPAPGQSFSKEAWKKILEVGASGASEGLQADAIGGRVKRVEAKFQWEPARPAYYSRFEYEASGEMGRQRTSVSAAQFGVGAEMYTFLLLEPKRRHDADPNRFERILATYRLAD